MTYMNYGQNFAADGKNDVQQRWIMTFL